MHVWGRITSVSENVDSPWCMRGAFVWLYEGAWCGAGVFKMCHELCIGNGVKCVAGGVDDGVDGGVGYADIFIFVWILRIAGVGGVREFT